MTMHDQPAVIVLARKKRFSDPQQVVLVLLVQRPRGIDTSMDKKAQTVIESEPKRTKPCNMLRREFPYTGGIIAPKRHVTAIPDPILSIQLVVNSCQRERLVIAQETDRVCAQPRLKIHDVVNHAAAITTPVDVVAYEDKFHRPSVCFVLTFAYQTGQGMQGAMNITNGIDPFHNRAR